MGGLWGSIIQAGVNLQKSWRENRHIILCNRTSITLSIFTFFLVVLGVGYFGVINSVKLGSVATVIFLFPILLNKQGYYNASRIFLVLSISIVLLIASILDKFDFPNSLEEFQYFQFRLLLLAASIFPLIIFNLNERKMWSIGIFINLACLVLYDPVHHLFGVDYYQAGFNGPHYYFLNYIVLVTFLVLVSGTYFLKYGFEKYEQRNEALIQTLHTINRTLNEKSQELTSQKEELLRANEVIEQQRELLERENVYLNQELLEKNRQLTETNRELIRHNNDLQQFSYTVSHNLRGPVASLMGLIHILQKDNLVHDKDILLQHVYRSAMTLNTVIYDLSSIIDIRNTGAQIKQSVKLEEEIDIIKTLLKKQIDDHEVLLKVDIERAPEVTSVKPMVNSILYNLISNAIKYRSPNRPPVIRIKSSIWNGYIRIDVSDNGLGLDVERFKEKIFGLYKRFHSHTEGKGLGLFLVKLQTEALHGFVNVTSVLDTGTTFSVYLKILESTDDPLLHSEMTSDTSHHGLIN